MKQLTLDKQIRSVLGLGMWAIGRVFMQTRNAQYGTRACIGVIALSVLAAWPLASQTPVIDKITFSPGIPSPTQMTIFGKNFGTLKPTVMMDGLTQTVTLNTDTQVTVLLNPTPMPAGAYRLRLLNNSESADETSRSTVFEATVGVIGAQGPIGNPGPAGPTGPSGAVGGVGLSAQQAQPVRLEQQDHRDHWALRVTLAQVAHRVQQVKLELRDHKVHRD
jgi:IPT/TIG domain